jgi:hypothetical protein
MHLRNTSDPGPCPVYPNQAQDSFEIRDAKWRLTAVKKLPTAERPDPPFGGCIRLVAGCS